MESNKQLTAMAAALTLTVNNTLLKDKPNTKPNASTNRYHITAAMTDERLLKYDRKGYCWTHRYMLNLRHFIST